MRCGLRPTALLSARRVTHGSGDPMMICLPECSGNLRPDGRVDHWLGVPQPFRLGGFAGVAVRLGFGL